MKQSIITIFKITPSDPEEVRKKKILNFILFGLAIVDIMVMIGIFILLLIGVDIGEQKGTLSIFTITPIFLFILVVLFIINNYIASLLANQIFLILFIVLIILADSPKELVEGRSTIYFYLPIFLAGILLKPLSSFLIALFISFISLILCFISNSTPNILAIGTFLIVGLIMWFYAKHLQQSLSHSEEAYNRSNFYKDIFSHDINNILQNILSSSQLLSQYINYPKKEEKYKEVLKILDEEVTRGAFLVSNIKKLSELEEEVIILKNIDGLAVLNNTIKVIRKSYRSRNLNIRINHSFDKMIVLANELLNNVFENLLINAIRHNNNPIIDISINISKEKVHQINYFKCEFMDNGIGIINEMKELIFVRTPNSTKYIGGLGLSLVKQIMEKFKGQIWVEDKVIGDYTQGSKFILLFPEIQ
ncbi:MAG: sensor histidine kinase [Promethearchaeota archaeon]